ncbi:MAG: class I SAM-dependent methyltransferase, partial [Alphaproteobacteria bacterium]|nr:class I SAM-dependent methyltransferase [Alphaproteobacteria bacterium]
MVNRRRPDALHRRLEHAVARVGGELTACRLCRGIEFAELRDFARLPRVSSDCRPWPAGGRLVVCRACGMPQSAIDSEGRAELAAIYRDYSLNAPWGGREVAVRADPRGAMERRSAGLMRRLATEVRLPARGQALDIGCGTGAMLAAFGEHRGGWRLHGHDLDTRNARLLAALPGFAMLHTGAISAVPGRFDLVTLSHSLEHMLDPRAVLADIVGRLAPRGRLFVQVPDWHANPWDLVVADHVAHFDAVTLPELMASAGFACRIVAAWAPRELSALAVKAGRADPPALDP